MDASDRKHWLRLFFVGVIYFVIGIVFGAFASGAATNAMRITWNRLAFLLSGVIFMVHIGHEYFRLRHSPRITATHAAVAVAIGAFLLALLANIHDLGSASGYRPRMLIALAAWPLLTAVPAFIVALVVTTGISFGRLGR